MKWQMKVYHEVLKWILGIFHIHKPISRKTQQRGKSQILLCHGMSRTLPSQVHPCTGPRLLTGAQDQPRKVTNRLTFLRQKFTSLVPAIYSTSVFLPQVTYIYLLFPLARAGVSLEPFYPICSHIRCTELQTGDRASENLPQTVSRNQVLEQGFSPFKTCWTFGNISISSWKEQFWIPALLPLD